MTERVKCIECENMILPETAARNEGLCGQCVKIPPKLRAEKRENERRLASGLVLTPSGEELASSSTPGELLTARWQLQPEYYAAKRLDSAVAAIAEAMSESNGNVFLVTENGGQLNLGFTERYGVCEFQNQESGEFRYAYSDANLREQVLKELHVVQACPCCGVGMLWYPSRYHMPREMAFSILENAVANRATPDVQWLSSIDDISYTQPGRG
ncbi:MAG: hypothetical protein GXY83_19035 [Rhodopirellula sp.]|nr:hypothetical protein [Rhodopirellula sp.]